MVGALATHLEEENMALDVQHSRGNDLSMDKETQTAAIDPQPPMPDITMFNDIGTSDLQPVISLYLYLTVSNIFK